MKFVVGIIAGILITVVGGLLLAPFFGSGLHAECMKCMEARADINSFNMAIGMFASNNDRYPTTNEGLHKLVDKFLETVPKDPWGNEYEYFQFENENMSCYTIWSLGSDGVPGGQDEPSEDYHVFSKMGNCLTKQ